MNRLKRLGDSRAACGSLFYSWRVVDLVFVLFYKTGNLIHFLFFTKGIFVYGRWVGWVLFEYTLDLPQPQPPHITYTDELSVTSQCHQIQTATIHLQQYIIPLEEWLQNNRMSTSSQKSSITLFNLDRRENKHPRIPLENNPIPK